MASAALHSVACMEITHGRQCSHTVNQARLPYFGIIDIVIGVGLLTLLVGSTVIGL